MNETEINGLGRQTAGGLQAGVGRLTGDDETRFKGEATKLRGGLERAIGKGADVVDGWLDRASPQVRDGGRKLTGEARSRPVLTAAALGVLALFVAGAGRRRH